MPRPSSFLFGRRPDREADLGACLGAGALRREEIKIYFVFCSLPIPLKPTLHAQVFPTPVFLHGFIPLVL